MKISVIGLGKIGASLCADLKEREAASELTGVDTNPESVDYCLSKGIVDKGFETPALIPPDTEICVLAVPVEFMADAAREVFAVIKPPAVLTDVGSVKVPVAQSIARILPDGIFFVPAHPIAGDETHGAKNSRTGIFDGCPVIITDFPGSLKPPAGFAGASEKVERMWKKTGARIMKMPAREHDRLFAFASHLPHVCAYCLALAASAGDSEAASAFALSGGGLKDTTRIAMSDPELWAGILIQNSQDVLEAMEVFSAIFSSAAGALKSGDRAKLTEILRRGRDAKLAGK